MSDKQSQKAGANAQQYQVAGDLVVVQQGVSEQRAKEIAQETLRAALAEYSEEAQAVGFERASRFEDKLVGLLSDLERLDVFRDPAFQVLLRKAQVGAASTEREADHDILAQLLADRSTREARTIRASIDRAVEIVDLLDDEALTGLTVGLAVDQFAALAGELDQGLDVLDQLFEQLVEGPLPEGADWLDHLDTLDAVRLMLGGLGGLRPFAEIYRLRMPGYFSRGVDEDRDGELQGEMNAIGGVVFRSVDHSLKPGMKRLPVSGSEGLNRAFELMQMAPERQEEVRRIAVEGYGIDESEEGLLLQLDEAIGKRPHLAKVRDWWNAIPVGYQLTGVGRVLGRANAKRCDAKGMLPPLD